MSDSVRPHRWQPTRLPHPWDSPGKNTGVGCHFLLQCMKVKSESEVSHLCPTLATPWTTAYQAPQSMGFSRQKYWSGVPLPSPFIDIWLHWVLTAAPGLSLAAASRGYSAVVLHNFSLWGFSCCRAQALGCAGSVAVVQGLSCLEACGIFPDQGSNLHCKADS